MGIDKTYLSGEVSRVTVLGKEGEKSYEEGMWFDEKQVWRITIGQLHINGDPFDHIIGYSESGEMLFSINCYCPIAIEYLSTKEKK